MKCLTVVTTHTVTSLFKIRARKTEYMFSTTSV